MQKRKFTPEEDAIICQMVAQSGAKNWDLIAHELQDRTGRQVRDRYQNYLFPGYFNGEWTQEEDELLYSKISQIGHKWSRIKKFFPRRSANSIRNRWNCFMCRLNNHNIEDQKSIDNVSKSNIEYKNEMHQNIIYYESPQMQTNPFDIEKVVLKENKATQTKDSCFVKIKYYNNNICLNKHHH